MGRTQNTESQNTESQNTESQNTESQNTETNKYHLLPPCKREALA